MSSKVVYTGGEPTKGLSQSIWFGAPRPSDPYDNAGGFSFIDEFLETPVTGTPYTLVEGDTGSEVSQLATEVGGVVRLALDATDNDEVYFGGAEGAVLKIADGSGKAFFEARIRPDFITGGSIICGMQSEAKVAANLMADTQTDAAIIDTSDADFVGFICASDTDADGLDAGYQTTGGTYTVQKDVAYTLVADTWVKAGWYFDGSDTIKFYVGGVQVGGNLSISTSGFPNGEELNLVFGLKNSAGVAKTLDIDWWAYAQERV